MKYRKPRKPRSVHDWVWKSRPLTPWWEGEEQYEQCSKCGARRFGTITGYEYISGAGWERKGSPHCVPHKGEQ